MKPYYEDKARGIVIYHGDCAELLPSMRAAAVVTDPPYGVGVRYGPAFDDSRADYWPWFKERLALMRAAAPVVAFTHRVKALAEITDWDWVGVWNKPGSFGARIGNSPILPHWEPIFLYGIHSLGTKRNVLADVLTVNPQPAGNSGPWGRRERWSNGEMARHPTPKPLTLFVRLIHALCDKGPVLDPFMGSGTTLLAARDLGLSAVGIEIEERHCELAAGRLSQGVFDMTPGA